MRDRTMRRCDEIGRRIQELKLLRLALASQTGGRGRPEPGVAGARRAADAAHRHAVEAHVHAAETHEAAAALEELVAQHLGQTVGLSVASRHWERAERQRTAAARARAKADLAAANRT